MSFASIQAPGVYIREVPSGSRTIVGGATSITAFVGWTPRGPLDTPTPIGGFGEYERQFGGLHRQSPLSQAVRQFFSNGGGQALIVRVPNRGLGITLTAAAGLTGNPAVVRFEAEVSNPTATTFVLTIRGRDAAGEFVAGTEDSDTIDVTSTPAVTIAALDAGSGPLVTATVAAAPPNPDVPPVGILGSWPVQGGAPTLVLGPAPQSSRVLLGSAGDDLVLRAADPGRWGNRLTASVDLDDAPAGTFNLVLRELDAEGNIEQEEAHLGVSADDTHARHLTRVLERRSALARVASASFGTPAITSDPVVFFGGFDGAAPSTADTTGSDAEPRTGMHSLVDADLFNILCLPRTSWRTDVLVDTTFWQDAMTFVEAQRAFLLVDPPEDWASAADARAAAPSFSMRSRNAALIFPTLRAPDPLDDGSPRDFPPCGVAAGIFARTDVQRGLWKAPAGIDAIARGVLGPSIQLTDAEQGALNQAGIDAFRTFPVYGTVLWGARTLEGADELASEWKYIPVRRLALHLHENLRRGTQWAVFEPNGEALWAQLRLAVGGFMQGLFERGAFAGASKSEAYSVECSAQTTTQADIDRGVVNIVVRFAPLRPAEFVVLKIQQMVAQT